MLRKYESMVKKVNEDIKAGKTNPETIEKFLADEENRKFLQEDPSRLKALGKLYAESLQQIASRLEQDSRQNFIMAAREITSNFGENKPNRKHAAAYATCLTTNVIEEILGEKNVEQRALITARWLQVAKLSKEMNDYNSYVAIASAIGSAAVVRLNATFASLPENAKAIKSEIDRDIKFITQYEQTLKAAYNNPDSIPPTPHIEGAIFFEKESLESSQTKGKQPEYVNFLALMSFNKKYQIGLDKIVEKLELRDSSVRGGYFSDKEIGKFLAVAEKPKDSLQDDPVQVKQFEKSRKIEPKGNVTEPSNFLSNLEGFYPPDPKKSAAELATFFTECARGGGSERTNRIVDEICRNDQMYALILPLAEKLHGEENLKFIHDYYKFKQNPTAEGWVQLYNQHLKINSEGFGGESRNINISGDAVKLLSNLLRIDEAKIKDSDLSAMFQDKEKFMANLDKFFKDAMPELTKQFEDPRYTFMTALSGIKLDGVSPERILGEVKVQLVNKNEPFSQSLQTILNKVPAQSAPLPKEQPRASSSESSASTASTDSLPPELQSLVEEMAREDLQKKNESPNIRQPVPRSGLSIGSERKVSVAPMPTVDNHPEQQKSNITSSAPAREPPNISTSTTNRMKAGMKAAPQLRENRWEKRGGGVAMTQDELAQKMMEEARKAQACANEEPKADKEPQRGPGLGSKS